MKRVSILRGDVYFIVNPEYKGKIVTCDSISLKLSQVMQSRGYLIKIRVRK